MARYSYEDIVVTYLVHVIIWLTILYTCSKLVTLSLTKIEKNKINMVILLN